MYRIFSTLENLYQEMDRDKHLADAGVSSANRYPLRFVLFENFSDFYDFVHKCAEWGIQVVGIERWLNPQNPDVFPTYSSLANKICDYVNESKGQDAVIAPFSELARFYINKEFSSLVKTIRANEANYISQEQRLRIYIPLIGMHGKLDAFRHDNEIRIWECAPQNEGKHYRLILCRIADCPIAIDESLYSYCKNLNEWVTLWKQGKNVHSRIICCSQAIYNNSANARPDNAFDYTICQNVYEFLKFGLKLIPQDIQFKQADLPNWMQLAKEIKDIQNFNFEDFVLHRFNVLQLEEAEFMQFWFKTNDTFTRWLLKIYYMMKYCRGKYLCRVLAQCETTHTSELFDRLALLIFEEESSSNEIEERRVLLTTGLIYDAKITDQAELKLKHHLVDLSERPGLGHVEAMKYMSPLTDAERQLMITWYGERKISRESIKTLLPDLYAYTAPLPQGVFSILPWLEEYFNEYRISKISNAPTDRLTQILSEKNHSTASFETWKNEFKTVKTILANREDIEVYYWIDGLGIDWIPLITQMIERYHGDGVYLNEVYIAAAQLPTTTNVNKIELESLSHAPLKKVGNLDSFAHQSKAYPGYIYEELQLVCDAIKEAIKQFNGKKIAFVSDHGISYMAQYGSSLALASVKGDHFGRCAIWKKPPAKQDKKYVITDSGDMICSLSHDSLTNKTPSGQGAHGGATPEELLVPILIVSGQENQSNYKATLLECVLSVSNPVVKYEIKGILSVDAPVVMYNNVAYPLRKVYNNVYESEELRLFESCNKVTLKIGSFVQTDSVTVKTGVEEDDIFGDF